MRFKLSFLMAGLLSVTVLPGWAAEQPTVEQLAQQVNQLQQQITALKATQNRHATTHKKNHHKTYTAVSDHPRPQVSGVSTLPASGVTYLPVDLDVPGQSFVSSGPYIGIPLQYSGSNLIINNPSVNQDVALLNVRKNIHQRLAALGVTEEQDHAHVLLSGQVEGQAMYKDIGGGPTSTDIDLTGVTLDAYVLGPSDWLSSLISLTYDNNVGTTSGSLANNSRDLNSRVYVTQAFFTMGNYLKSPVYGTMGQIYVPFGTYGTNMVSSPLTKLMGRTKARAIVLGYQQQTPNALYGSAYIFHGDTYVGSTSRVSNGGVNLGYRLSQADGKVSGDIGGGVIANIADSVGMQAVSNSTAIFNGFGGVNGTGNEHIVHRVPAYNFRGTLSLGSKVDLLAEYITASTRFSKADLTMNNHGAKPQALNTEAAYTFQAFERPTSIVVGYAMTRDALALQLPEQRYSLVFNTSAWKDTIESLEFRHDINYGASNFATGSNMMVPTASGKADNAVTLQVDVYF